ncbi:hypothetical protein AGMMS50229_15310 [Campylobacterota bacterium]|nr:hypothetical protein AGMMS50229_15310 [Campylobacterota bacterium]
MVGFYRFCVLFFCFAANLWALSADEEARVNALLTELGKQTELIFIRNGAEHSAQEAESHLRLKLSNAGKRLSTAEQFIDRAASGSSISGKPYIVRIDGKTDEPANAFLHRLLKEIDNP